MQSFSDSSGWRFVCFVIMFQKGRHLCKNVHGRLHLWITGLQGAQAKPFKAGHDFAAVNAAERSRDMGYGSAGFDQS